MIHSAASIMLLAQQCAPAVHPATMTAIVMAESGGLDRALNVNGARIAAPRTITAAINTAYRHIRAGYSVDLGLAQINSKNLAALGLTVEQAFDPCRNLAAAARLLAANYRGALAGRSPQAALRIAFSRYNTGHHERGFRNGYVARVERAGRRVIGTVTDVDRNRAEPVAVLAVAAPPASETMVGPTSAVLVREAPAWDVFGRSADRTVILFQTAER